MDTTTSSMVVTTKEAKIILDWDDGQWYVSDIDYGNHGGSTGSNTGAVIPSSANNGGVKVPVWDTSYKYLSTDIVAYNGMLYVSKQNQNQGNSPSSGTFWWNPLVDLTSVDAITLEGKNLNEVMLAVLGGSSIDDFYKKKDVDNIVISYFNSVNAKKLNDWTFDDIKTNYTNAISASEKRSKDYTVEYLNNDGLTGFDQSLVDYFNTIILNDNINKP